MSRKVNKKGPCPPAAFGGRVQRPLVVVLVATHADLADVPRTFSGEFTYDKENVLLKEVRNRLGLQTVCVFFILIIRSDNAERNAPF